MLWYICAVFLGLVALGLVIFLGIILWVDEEARIGILAALGFAFLIFSLAYIVSVPPPWKEQKPVTSSPLIILEDKH